VDVLLFYSFYILCHKMVAFGSGVYDHGLQLRGLAAPSTTQNHFSNMTLVISFYGQFCFSTVIVNYRKGLPTQIRSNKILSRPLIAFLCLLDYQLIFPTQNSLNDTLSLWRRSDSREDHLHSLSTMQIAGVHFCIRGHWSRAMRR